MIEFVVAFVTIALLYGLLLYMNLEANERAKTQNRVENEQVSFQ